MEILDRLDAAQDLYGLGVRVGFYLQAIGMILYSFSRGRERGKGVKITSGSIALSILTSWFVHAARGLFNPTEAFVVLLIIFTLASPAKATFTLPSTILGEPIGLITILVVEIGSCIASLWFFTKLVVTLHYVGSPDIAPPFILRIRFDGWIRWVLLSCAVFNTIISLNFVFRVLLPFIRLSLQHNTAGDADNNDTVARIIEERMGKKKFHRLMRSMSWGMWGCTVIVIELSISGNSLNATTDLLSPGQLIPLISGSIILIDSAYRVARERLPDVYTKISYTFRPLPHMDLSHVVRGFVYSLTYPNLQSKSPRGLTSVGFYETRFIRLFRRGLYNTNSMEEARTPVVEDNSRANDVTDLTRH